jgi:hypothetical protein
MSSGFYIFLILRVAVFLELATDGAFFDLEDDMASSI